MTHEEYTKRLSEIRQRVNMLCFDLGATNKNFNLTLEKVLNDAMNGDLFKNPVETRPILKVYR